jgi:hypothetical protein
MLYTRSRVLVQLRYLNYALIPERRTNITLEHADRGF